MKLLKEGRLPVFENLKQTIMKPNCGYCRDLGKCYVYSASSVHGNTERAAYCMMCEKGINMHYDQEIDSLNKKRAQRLSEIKPLPKPEKPYTPESKAKEGFVLHCSNPSCENRAELFFNAKGLYHGQKPLRYPFHLLNTHTSKKPGNLPNILESTMSIWGCENCKGMTYTNVMVEKSPDSSMVKIKSIK